jgi:hypothetical protein
MLCETTPYKQETAILLFQNEQETGISESQPQLFRGDTCACHHKMIQVQVVIASVAGISRRWLMTEIVLRLEIFKRFET